MSENRSKELQDRPLQVVEWWVVLFALLPLGLFAYLGQFSRLMSDDYCAIAVGRELGAWQGTLYWFNNWAGSYANFFLKSALAPLDILLPRFTPTVIVIVWMLGAVLAGRLRFKRIGLSPAKAWRDCDRFYLGSCQRERILFSAVLLLVCR